jgi:hypothetical protein
MATRGIDLYVMNVNAAVLDSIEINEFQRYVKLIKSIDELKG